MRPRLTYANVTTTLALFLATALPVSALAAKNTLGEDRAAINRYAAHLAKVYEELRGEPLKWEIQQCLPHGPNGKRVDFLLCAIETPETYSVVAATNRRNRLPSGFSLAAENGQIDVYVTKPKPRTYRVPSGSMEPTLKVGQLVNVTRLVSPPQIGDIVVFHPPKAAEQVLCGPSPHVIKVGGAACAEPVPVQSKRSLSSASSPVRATRSTSRKATSGAKQPTARALNRRATPTSNPASN
jgi:hypothetical protein